MEPLPIPDWIRTDPEVVRVADFHLPAGSGISGPPAGAYLVNVIAENSLRPLPMWHVLFEVSDADLEALDRSRVLVMACSVVPIFQVYPFHRRIDGTLTEGSADG